MTYFCHLARLYLSFYIEKLSKKTIINFKVRQSFQV